MGDTAICIQGLGKRYRLGTVTKAYDTLRDTITEVISRMGKGSAQKSVDKSRYIWALRDLDLSIKQGEVLGIIGRNGAGKSTLLKILSRITSPTKGRVEIKGRVGTLLEVGTGFHPELTGRENIFLNGAILGMTRADIRKKFDEIVAFAEVEKFLDTPIKRYSSGMYVRLAFSVAAHLDPEILIVDEVLAVGDIAFQKKCLGKMGDVASSGRTVLFVSHNIGAITKLCKTALLLDKGSLVISGNTDNVVEQYLKQTEISVAEVSRNVKPESRVGFERIWVTNSKGETSPEIEVNSHFTINILLNVQKKVLNVDISVLIESIRGTKVCFTSLSDLNGGDILPLEPGRRHCKIQIPGRFLIPDTYRLLVEAHVPMVMKEDYCTDLSIAIVDTKATQTYTSDAWQYGCVIGNFKWDMETFSPDSK